MEAHIGPSRLSGNIQAPQSKSIAIRLLFASLLGNISIENLEHSDDVNSALRALRSMGVEGSDGRFSGGALPGNPLNINLSGSGTVLRMLIPVLATMGISASLTGDITLQKRPLGVLRTYLVNNGIQMSSDHVPLKIHGRLDTDEIEISGSESSQYISGFIFGLLIKGGGRIRLIPPVRSSSYIRMTCSILNSLGAEITYSGNSINVEELEKRLDFSGQVPGDFLLSSFYAIGSALTGGRMNISNLTNPQWSEGDSRIADIINRCTGTGTLSGTVWSLGPSEKINPFMEDVGDSPDMAVSLAALASGSTGKSGISGIELLGTKESDRNISISRTLKEYGCEVETGSTMYVTGPEKAKSGNTDQWHDHRIAMLGSILSLRAGGTIKGAESVSKSNPRFFDDLIRLGGDITLR